MRRLRWALAFALGGLSLFLLDTGTAAADNCTGPADTQNCMAAINAAAAIAAAAAAAGAIAIGTTNLTSPEAPESERIEKKKQHCERNLAELNKMADGISELLMQCKYDEAKPIIQGYGTLWSFWDAECSDCVADRPAEPGQWDHYYGTKPSWIPDGLPAFGDLGKLLMDHAPKRVRDGTPEERAKYLYGQLQNVGNWYGLKVNVGPTYTGAAGAAAIGTGVGVGAYAGGQIGGAIGALTGPAAPVLSPLGALIGALVGGAAGAIAGGAGDSLYERLGTTGSPESSIRNMGVGGCGAWANAFDQILKGAGMRSEVVMMGEVGATAGAAMQGHDVTQTATLLEWRDASGNIHRNIFDVYMNTEGNQGHFKDPCSSPYNGQSMEAWRGWNSDAPTPRTVPYNAAIQGNPGLEESYLQACREQGKDFLSSREFDKWQFEQQLRQLQARNATPQQIQGALGRLGRYMDPVDMQDSLNKLGINK